METLTVLMRLGQGSFSSVLLVQDPATHKLFALKKVTVEDPSREGQVLGEVKVLKELDHPNIIKLVTHEVAAHELNLVMEYANDGDLGKKISEHKHSKIEFHEKMIRRIMAQMLLALKYIHSKNVIHRDIKPHNILCTKHGILKLSDFGISTILDDDRVMAQTSVGTPYYLAPELVNGEPYSYSVDMWMLGCTLYELCTLQRPFTGTCLQEIMLKICTQALDQQALTGRSDFLRKAVTSMVEKQPHLRPSVASLLETKEMKDEVRQLLREFPEIYKDIISSSKGRKRDLALDIQDPADRMIAQITNKEPNSAKIKKTSSTKNRESDNSIFRVIERAKAKSNGTTPQNMNPSASSTPSHSQPTDTMSVSQSMVSNTGVKVGYKHIPPALQLSSAMSCYSTPFTGTPVALKDSVEFDSSIKKGRDFKSPTSIDQPSPNGLHFVHKKKSRNGFSFISSIFGKHNPQSPARVTLAKKFLKEKIGEELFQQIEALYAADPKLFPSAVRNLLGSDHKHMLQVVEYVFLSEESSMGHFHLPEPKMQKFSSAKAGLSSGLSGYPSMPQPFNSSFGKPTTSLSLSPISAGTESTGDANNSKHAESKKKDELGMTFGAELKRPAGLKVDSHVPLLLSNLGQPSSEVETGTGKRAASGLKTVEEE